MKHYLAMHCHRHGDSYFPFRSKTNWAGEPTDPDKIQALAEALGIDFEPDKNEWITIVPLDLNKIPIVP